jgi:hypothetical protein
VSAERGRERVRGRGLGVLRQRCGRVERVERAERVVVSTAKAFGATKAAIAAAAIPIAAAAIAAAAIPIAAAAIAAARRRRYRLRWGILARSFSPGGR